MKIGSFDKSVPLPPVAGDRKAGAPAGAPAPASPPSSATVALSPEATALASAADDGSFDAAKVDRIGKSIENGTFKVNPEAIADKLIANAQELLARTYR